MFRLLFLVFHGESRADEHVRAHIHESPPVMTVPLIILAVLAVIGGFVVFEGVGKALGFDSGWLGFVYAHEPEEFKVLLQDKDDGPIEIEQAIWRISAGLDLLPSTLALARFETLAAQAANRDLYLKLALEAVWQRYDYCLVDCPPRFVPDPLREIIRLAATLPRLVFPSRRFRLAGLLCLPVVVRLQEVGVGQTTEAANLVVVAGGPSPHREGSQQDSEAQRPEHDVVSEAPAPASPEVALHRVVAPREGHHDGHAEEDHHQ